ncbi:MAG: DNA-directed RNA polymerase subunit alpha C-terminal domain-containing protein [Mobilitalea sp.]
MKPELSLIKIGKPAQRALQNAGILTLDQLTRYSEKELLALHGFGPKALGILKQVLTEHNLSFK